MKLMKKKEKEKDVEKCCSMICEFLIIYNHKVTISPSFFKSAIFYFTFLALILFYETIIFFK